MNLRRIVILCASAMSFLFAQTPAWPGPKPVNAPSSAQLTEAHGLVYKRGFQDWRKELWDDPIPAAKGDTLTEGMQIGTGAESWAQLAWPNITTRAWSNSVYAIAPSRRLVYLTGGEMLYHLDKHRKDKDPYYVWTNLLQARIRGTTVLFQCTKNVSRITVLEGVITVLNRKDHSVVELKPGVVYEVRDKSCPDAKQETSTLTPITRAHQKPTELFSTKNTIASISEIDVQAIADHPLLKSFDSPLSSLPLINETMSTVQNLVKGAAGLESGTLKLLSSSIGIISLPKTLAYEVAPFAAQNLSLPLAMMEAFPPAHEISLSPGGLPVRLASVGSSGLSMLSGAARSFNLGSTQSLAPNIGLPSIGGGSAFSAGLPYAGAGGGSVLQGTTGVLANTHVSTGSGGVANALGAATSGLLGPTGTGNLLQNTLNSLLPHFP